MTLISLINNFNRPVLLGDILTTSNDNSIAIEIPTFLKEVSSNLPKQQRNFPYSLKQKIYVISPSLAVGMAGNVHQMTQFLEDLRIYFRYTDVSYESYQRFISSYNLLTLSECAIVICLINQLEDRIVFSDHYLGNWDRVEHPRINNATVTGTGTSSFIQVLNSFGDVDGKNVDAVSNNLMMLSFMIANERFTLNSILEAWGAGFELIECSNGSFKKVDDLTYVIWKGKLTEQNDDLEGQPLLILHYKYIDEILLIRCYTGVDVKGYAVLPLDMKRELVNRDNIPNNIDFTSSKVVSTLMIEGADGRFHFPTLYSETGDGIETMRVKVEPNGSIQIMFRQDKSEEIARYIAEL